MEDKITARPGERILIWFLLLFSIFILVQAFMMPHLENLSSSGAFPIFIASIMILCTLRILWKNHARYSALKIGEEIEKATHLVFPKTVAAYTAILILYILLLYPLHFWVSSSLFLIGSFLFLRGAKIIRSLFIAAALLTAIYFLFQYLFRVIFW
jgi:putative tricarboxylic transport membrane protein